VVETACIPVTDLQTVLSLTFTIGWLKLVFRFAFIELLDFNFHHRVVETTYYLRCKPQPGDYFNFHHRVVETSQVLKALL